jgi:hypothetical protein
MKSHKLINIKLKLRIQKVKVNVVEKQKSGWLVLQPSAFYRWFSTHIFSRTNIILSANGQQKKYLSAML